MCITACVWLGHDFWEWVLAFHLIDGSRVSLPCYTSSCFMTLLCLPLIWLGLQMCETTPAFPVDSGNHIQVVKAAGLFLTKAHVLFRTRCQLCMVVSMCYHSRGRVGSTSRKTVVNSRPDCVTESYHLKKENKIKHGCPF